jgi:hypothetical protein
MELRVGRFRLNVWNVRLQAGRRDAIRARQILGQNVAGNGMSLLLDERRLAARRLIFTSKPTAQPFPGFGLHFEIEFVRGVVQAGTESFRDSGFFVTGGELFKRGMNPIEIEKTIAATVNHQESRG